MSKTKIIRNKTLKEYKDTYPNYKDLEKHTIEEVSKNKDLLKDKTWWLIDNTYYEAKDEKKKNAIAAWWSNLGKGARTAICVLGGAAVITGITVPTVFAIKSCTPSVRKIIVNGEVTHTSEFKADGSLKATINPTDPNKEISKLDIKIGDYTLKENEYTFTNNELNISADVIKAHKGNVVITAALAEIKFAYIDWVTTKIDDMAYGFDNKTLYEKAKEASSIIFKKDNSTNGKEVNESGSDNKIYATFATNTLTIWSDAKIAFSDNDLPIDVPAPGVEIKYGLFWKCATAVSIDLGKNVDTSKITNMNCMFNGCALLTSLDLSNFNTSSVTNMNSMFSDCPALTNIVLSSLFNTEKVEDMGYMFSGCKQLTSIDVSKFNTSKVTDMGSMFSDCLLIKSLNLSSFDTSKVTTMNCMFGVTDAATKMSLESISFSNAFKTGSVRDMDGMFYGCNKLTSLDLSSFSFEAIEDTGGMFENCKDLTTIYVKEGTDLSSHSELSYSTDMFKECTNLKGADGTEYNSGKTNKEYARIDKKNSDPSKPGYFTKK